MSLLTIYTALLMRVREGLVKEKPLWHLHRSSEIESVDELQFAIRAVDETHSAFPKT